MTFPTTFATLSGNQPLSLLDTMFGVVGGMGQINCTASGTNTILLTPSPNMPFVSSYTAYNPNQLFGFQATSTTTGATTINVAGVGAKNAYEADGVTQVVANGFLAGAYYLVVYNAALNSGSGGFQKIGGAAIAPSGQYVSSTVLVGSAVPLTSTIPVNVTSISLTAGNWDVSANAWFNGNSATTVNGALAGISTTTSILPSGPDGLASVSLLGNTVFAGSNQFSLSLVPTRLILGSTTTVYLVVQSQFGTSTESAYGIIGARKV